MNNLKIKSFTTLVICCLLVSCSNDNVNFGNDIYLNIPDNYFETILIEQGIDSDGVINQKMLKSDAKAVSKLDLNLTKDFGEVTDLTGIEGFVNITLLSAARQNIESIDLSFNTLLDTIYLPGNVLSNIDLSNNTNLIFVDIQANELSSIKGLSNAIHLKDLDLSWNYFKEFSIDNEFLEILHMRNNDLTTLNIDGAINLKNVLLTTNQLTSLDVSNNTLIETLLIADNKIEHINFEYNTNLTHLYIFDNSLLNLDISTNKNLIDLKADRNPNLNCIKISDEQGIPFITLSNYQELNTLCN